MLEYRCGLTAVVGWRRGGRLTCRGRIPKARRASKRKSVAMLPFGRLSRQARLSAMMDQPDVAWGIYPAEFAGATAWLLPNPSGLNKAFTLEALVEAYSDLRVALLVGSLSWDFRSR